MLTPEEKNVLRLILDNAYNTVELLERNGYYTCNNTKHTIINRNVIFTIAEKLDCQLSFSNL